MQQVFNGSFENLIITLLILGLLLLISRLLIKNKGRVNTLFGSISSQSDRIKIESTKSIGKADLVIVNIENKRFVLAVTPSSVTVVNEIESNNKESHDI